MRRCPQVALRGALSIFLALYAGLSSGRQAAAPAPRAQSGKVCVADIANSSTRPVFTGRIKEHLLERLQKENVNAYDAYAATMLAKELEISVANKAVMRREKCDYMLLLEAAKPSGREPASSAEMVIEFALFKKGQLSVPILRSSSAGTAPEDPTEAAFAAADAAAIQIARFLHK